MPGKSLEPQTHSLTIENNENFRQTFFFILKKQSLLSNSYIIKELIQDEFAWKIITVG